MIGVVERLFFTVGAVFVPPSAIVPAMVAWVGVKMASGWNLEPDRKIEKRDRIAALAEGLASMFFALVGGLIVNGRIR